MDLVLLDRLIIERTLKDQVIREDINAQDRLLHMDLWGSVIGQ